MNENAENEKYRITSVWRYIRKLANFLLRITWFRLEGVQNQRNIIIIIFFFYRPAELFEMTSTSFVPISSEFSALRV